MLGDRSFSDVSFRLQIQWRSLATLDCTENFRRAAPLCGLRCGLSVPPKAQRKYSTSERKFFTIFFLAAFFVSGVDASDELQATTCTLALIKLIYCHWHWHFPGSLLKRMRNVFPIYPLASSAFFRKLLL